MSRAHPLAVRLRDLRIEAALWSLAAIAAPLAMAGGMAIFLYSASPLPGIWVEVQAAHALSALGLGDLNVPGWHQPAAFLSVLPDVLGEPVAAAWADDFQAITRAGLTGLALISLAFFTRLAWPALTREKEV